jgi:hypothetical protein
MEKSEIVSERQNIVLMTLYSFYERGKEEVSLPEFLECIKKIQEKIPLKYEFSERFLYSLDLLEDLRDLEYRGFAHRFTYRHDAFLPKSYITLTGFGRSHAKKVAHKVPVEYLPILEKCSKAIIETHREKWIVHRRQVR